MEGVCKQRGRCGIARIEFEHAEGAQLSLTNSSEVIANEALQIGCIPVHCNGKLDSGPGSPFKSWLVKQGIDSMRISAKGYGPENPIADNATLEGRQKNRRIEFFRTR
jgi:hypothetical protein